MSNRNTVRLFLFVVAGLVGLHMIAIRGQKPAPAPASSGAKLLPAPKVGSSMTVQALRNIIRTNSASADFLLACTSNRQPIPAGSSPVGLAGSMGLTPAALAVINSNLNTTVTVKDDPALINALVTKGQVDNATKVNYQKILLWFELGGFRFYLNDPYPGLIVSGRTNVAASIVKKWQIQ